MQSLQEVFGQRAGRFTQIGARHAYRLGLNAEPRSTLRTLAIGNAAQTLHPVAGQGLNLGLRDASVLASLLAKEITPESLSTFSTAQRNDRRMTTSLTDLMARVFASSPDQSIVQGLLGLSLGLIDIVPAAKRLLAEQMMYGVR
jgi:2-octaprenyl-6-methoxyphenol hydroxylase